MKTLDQNVNNGSEQVELLRLVKTYLALPVKRQERVNELVLLLQNSDCHEEQCEIVEAIGEIIEPSESVGKASSPDEGVDPKSDEALNAYKKETGKAIRNRRKELKLSQEELAEKTGLTQNHISKLENGVHSPTAFTIDKIAEALETKPSKLDVLY